MDLTKPLAGLKYLDSFFKEERLNTKCKRGISYNDFLLISDEQLPGYVTRFLQNNPKSTKYSAFQLYFGSINQFRPSVAHALYQRFKPTSILDFSAGWGGRLLASKGIPYTGFDTNTNLREPYEKLIKEVGYGRVIFQDSATVDFSLYDYDFVFTSPPYYKKEVYNHMPEYSSFKDWTDRFLEPVVRNSYQHMKSGHYCLNIPEKIYLVVKDWLGEACEKIPLGNPRNYKKQKEYKEFIYVWKKL
jgi:hypothetical protein